MDDYGNVVVIAENGFHLAAAQHGLTALAAYDQARYYQGDGNGPDEEDMTYGGTPKEAAEAHLRAAVWERPCKGIHDIRHAQEIEEALWIAIEHRRKEAQLTAEVLQAQGRKLVALEAQVKYLLAKVGLMETENIGLRTNVANMEHRCTCTHGNGGGL